MVVLLTVHDGERTRQCKICDRNFGQQGSLKMHIKLVHEGERDYQCNICNKSFAGTPVLLKHMPDLYMERERTHVTFVRKVSAMLIAL